MTNNYNNFQKKNSAKGKFNFKISFWLSAILALVILFSVSAGLIALNRASRILDQKVSKAQEAARPADISVTIIKDSQCSDCFSVEPMIKALEKENVRIKSTQTVDWASAAGKKLIAKYKITKVPSLIISGELAKNKTFQDLLAKFGDIEGQTFILRKNGAPYLLVSSGEVKGQVKIVMLKDDRCSDCYNVKLHLPILEKFGLSTTNQTLIDVNSVAGRKLVKQYRVRLVPTIILIGDVSAYPALKQIWPRVGTVEKDGTYIFRSGVKSMGVYQDLVTNRTIKPQTKKQTKTKVKTK